jgi:hypothetical protein
MSETDASRPTSEASAVQSTTAPQSLCPQNNGLGEEGGGVPKFHPQLKWAMQRKPSPGAWVLR